MKKLFVTVLGIASLVVCLQAQPYVMESVVLTIPNASLQTNLIDGPCSVYSITFNPLACASVTTNLVYELRDSPRVNTPRSGTATANILEYTNTGYTYYTKVISNMNWGFAGLAILGVNSNVNYAGVITTITNSPVLSNYMFTVSNFQAGAAALRPVKISGGALTNTTTVVTFPDGMPFALGVSMTNKAGVAAIQTGYTITIEYLRPF